MMKLIWTSQISSINHALFYRTSTILIPPNPLFALRSLLWENSSMTKPSRPISLCPDHLPSPFSTPPFVLPHPLPTNASNTSSLKIAAGECSNTSSAKDPLVLVVSSRIWIYIYDLQVVSSEDLVYFINRAAILNNNIILSKQDVSPNITFEQVLTQLMAFQSFPPFLDTK